MSALNTICEITDSKFIWSLLDKLAMFRKKLCVLNDSEHKSSKSCIGHCFPYSKPKFFARLPLIIVGISQASCQRHMYLQIHIICNKQAHTPRCFWKLSFNFWVAEIEKIILVLKIIAFVNSIISWIDHALSQDDLLIIKSN